VSPAQRKGGPRAAVTTRARIGLASATPAAAVVLAVISLAAGAAAAAAQELTVKGDQQAWLEITAASARQSQVRSYRAKMTAPGSVGNGGTIEVVNPDRYHVVVEQFESIQVGRNMRIRTGGGPWQCPPTGPPVPESTTDPSRMSGEVEAVRGPAVAIDSVATQSYTFTWKSPGAVAAAGVPNTAMKTRLFVANASGLPKRMQILGDNDQVDVQFDYEYDIPITIDLPPCA